MCRVIAILLAIVFNMLSYGTAPSCDISITKKIIRGDEISCDVTVTAPQNWKFPKDSRLTIKNISDFQNVAQTMTEHDNSHCKFHISAQKKYVSTLMLEIESPMCNNICVLDLNRVQVDFGGNFGLFLYILLGFIGGLILNIMPCVLPVILMKLRAFNSRIGLLGSICGNYASFAVLTVGLLFLKSVGDIIGWGMHFQSTGFLSVTAFILFLLTLSAFNIIHINMSWNMQYNSRSIFLKNFISAAVATFIAIPCVAPFLGVAVTFAIQGTSLQLVAIFVAIATGFSFPYIFMLLFGIKIPQISSRVSYIFDKIVGGGVLITFLWVLWLLFRNISAPESQFEQQYKQVLALRKNQVVMMNITADWCLTCQYNHRYIFGNKKVQQVLQAQRVQVIDIDITKKDPNVTEFLHKHNRVGIPFTIIYGPKSNDGILLKEMPSIDDVIDAVGKAK